MKTACRIYYTYSIYGREVSNETISQGFGVDSIFVYVSSLIFVNTLLVFSWDETSRFSTKYLTLEVFVKVSKEFYSLF
jgi:hypothetical protein